MELNQYIEKGYVVLQPNGELDASSSSLLDDKVKECIEDENCYILIDCSKLKYISSAGIGIFLSHKDELDELNGHISFFSLNESVKDVFELLGMDEIFTLADSMEDIQDLLNKQN